MKIYFDMDGVLADFNRGVRELCGFEPKAQGSGKEADDALFAAIQKADRFFWNLKPVEGAKELFDRVYRQYGENCEILTAVPRPEREIPEAAENKVGWVREKLSGTVKVNTVTRREKINFCHGPEDVLIDDYQKNIDAWNEAGGTGILFVDAEAARKELVRRGILMEGDT